MSSKSFNVQLLFVKQGHPQRKQRSDRSEAEECEEADQVLEELSLKKVQERTQERSKHDPNINLRTNSHPENISDCNGENSEQATTHPEVHKDAYKVGCRIKSCPVADQRIDEL